MAGRMLIQVTESVGESSSLLGHDELDSCEQLQEISIEAMLMIRPL